MQSDAMWRKTRSFGAKRKVQSKKKSRAKKSRAKNEKRKVQSNEKRPEQRKTSRATKSPEQRKKSRATKNEKSRAKKSRPTGSNRRPQRQNHPTVAANPERACIVVYLRNIYMRFDDGLCWPRVGPVLRMSTGRCVPYVYEAPSVQCGTGEGSLGPPLRGGSSATGAPLRGDWSRGSPTDLKAPSSGLGGPVASPEERMQR